MKCYKCKVKLKKDETECPNCGKSIKELKKVRLIRRLIKLLILIAIVGIIVGIVKLNEHIQKTYNNNRIQITSFENLSETGDTLFSVSEKINNIDGEILSFGKIESGHIKLYVENLVLLDQDINDKKFSITDINLAVGINQLDVSYIIDGKEIKRTFYIYNQTEENLGSLDSKDPDSDNVPNYLEEAFNTNKNSKDTDNDGLTDYEEIYMTYTDPANPKTNGEILDSKYDTDGDRVVNSDELKNKTNPLNPDTDGDGLDDGYEIQYKSNPLKMDTDEDGISDYDEVMNFATSPTNKDTIVTGNIYNKDNVIVTMQNVKAQDIDNVKVTKAGYAILNEKLDGYIMAPYKIETSISGTPLISFNLNDMELKDGVEPKIYEIDSNTQEYKELTTYVSNGKIYSAQVGNQNDLYMIFDKKYLSKTFNTISEGASSATIEVPQYTHYVMIDVPIAHFFTNDSVKIYCYGEFDEEKHKQIEKTIENKLDNLIDIEFVQMNPVIYEITKKIQAWVIDITINNLPEEDKDLVQKIQCINPESEGTKIAEAGVVADFVGAEDLENYFFGEYTGIISTNIQREIDLKDSKDSNNDGISDAMTELIISGQVTTKEGYNPFKGLTLEQINRTDDYDNDGLKNSEEIIVTGKDGVYEITMKSDPTKKDTDDDGIVDKKDPYPLVSFDSRYVLRNSLQGEPTNVYALMKDVEQTNSLFGTGKLVKKDDRNMVEYTDFDGVKKYVPCDHYIEFALLWTGAEGGHIYARDAAKAHDMYNSTKGLPFTEKDATKNLRKDSSIQYYLQETIEYHKDLAIQAVADGETLIFENKNLMPGVDDSHTTDGKSQSVNTFGFLHICSSDSIARISNNNGIYNIQLRYFVEDIYDWKGDKADQNLAGDVEAMYFCKLLLGEGKAFLVHIEYDMEIVYNSKTGETKIVDFDTPVYK